MSFRTSAFLALAAAAAKVSAQGQIDNSANAQALLAKAVPLSGLYQLASDSEGTTLTYEHDTQPNMYPSSDPLEQILQEIENAFSEPVVNQTFTLTPNDDGSNTVRIANTASNKCFSQQWDFSTGVDGYAVAYTCAVGPDAVSGTDLDPAKQYFLLIPADDDSSSSSSSSGSEDYVKPEDDESSSSATPTASATSSAASSTSSCEKSSGWVWRHEDATAFFEKHPDCLGTGEAPACTKDQAWLKEHEDYIPSHPSCQAVLDGDSSGSDSSSSSKVKRHGERAVHRRRLQEEKKGKRDGSGSGRYFLVLYDHLTDMQTRAVSAVETSAFAGAKAAQVVPYDPTDESQVWTITQS